MKLNMTKEWLLEKLALVGDTNVSVGRKELVHVSVTPKIETKDIVETELKHEFSKLIHLLRRNKRLSVEQLSNEADIDIDKIIQIERDENYQAETRTVYQLANYFKLNAKALHKLAGNIHEKNSEMYEESIRFAAKSAPIDKLSPEEHAALEGFVAYLNRK